METIIEIIEAKASDLFEVCHVLVFDRQTADLIGTNSDFYRFNVRFNELHVFENEISKLMTPGTSNMVILTRDGVKENYVIFKKNTHSQAVFSIIPLPINIDSIEELKKDLSTDFLTGLSNRKVMMAAIDDCCKAAEKGLSVSSVLMIDIDNFKKINDEFGHDIGDQALKHVADLLKNATRLGDKVGRIGGEEFLLILSDTSIAGATVVAEKILSALKNKPLLHSENRRHIATLSVSIGVYGTNTFSAVTPSDLLKRADEALFAAKANGKNTYEIYQ